MVYGRTKAVPPPATPFEEFMATTSERMIAARLELVEFLRETPAAWFAIGVVILVLAASSLNLRGKKKSAAGGTAAPAADAAADVAAPAKPAVAVDASAPPTGGEARRRSLRKAFSKATGLSGFFSGKKKTPAAAAPAPAMVAFHTGRRAARVAGGRRPGRGAHEGQGRRGRRRDG